MLYLPDTNILIAALKNNPLVLAQLGKIPKHNLRLSTIVLGELEFGAEKSKLSAHNRNRLNGLKSRYPLLGIDENTATHYGLIRHALESRGTPIGANDLWIAAQARSIGATLVTNNEREFRRVEGLLIQNWMTTA